MYDKDDQLPALLQHQAGLYFGDYEALGCEFDLNDSDVLAILLQ